MKKSKIATVLLTSGEYLILPVSSVGTAWREAKDHIKFLNNEVVYDPQKGWVKTLPKQLELNFLISVQPTR